jgi:hypothetical protein
VNEVIFISVNYVCIILELKVCNGCTKFTN